MNVPDYEFWGIDKGYGTPAVEKYACDEAANQRNGNTRSAKSATENYRLELIVGGPENAGKYVPGLRIITQIDTPTDSKQVSKRFYWYRLVPKGIGVILSMLRLGICEKA